METDVKFVADVELVVSRSTHKFSFLCVCKLFRCGKDLEMEYMIGSMLEGIIHLRLSRVLAGYAKLEGLMKLKRLSLTCGAGAKHSPRPLPFFRNDGGDLDSSWSELLEEPHSGVAFIGGALFVLQQFAGINAVLYFSSLTFKDAGVTNGALASLYVGLTNFAGALCALYLLDRQGRQKLIIGSYLGMLQKFLAQLQLKKPLINFQMLNRWITIIIVSWVWH